MDVRAQILSQATRLFAARGFDGTSLQDIADAVGVRKPSLLYHFPSKDELRRSVLENVLSHWNDVLPRLLLAATSGEGQFEGVVQEMVSFFAADPDRARLIVREVLDRPDDVREMIATHVRPWVEIACDYIRKGQRHGRVYEEVDPEAYVVQVINLVISGVATYECIGSLLPARSGGAGRVPPRHTAELLRVARSSLFRPDSDTTPE
jgi:TetR/AcrR family transcriptional regulator